MATPAGRWVVEAARPDDDAGLRALLASRAMGGAIRLRFERSPSVWIAAGVEGERHFTVVAREQASGRVVGMGSRAVRRVWVDGERARMGYLAQLRLAPGVAAGRRLLAAGYAACEARRRGDELPFDLTSVVADNAPARRLVERGLPGLPRYRRLCGLVTLTIPTGRRRGWRRRTDGDRVVDSRLRGNDGKLARVVDSRLRGNDGKPARVVDSRLRGKGGRGAERVGRGSDERLPAIVDCLERNLGRFQLAPVWTEDDLTSPRRTPGLAADDFVVWPDDADRVAGCAAVWDQRGFKQVVVDSYAPGLARVRPLLNVALAVGGRPRLPPPGSTLDLAYLSHLAVDGDRADVAAELIRAARRAARRRGLDYLTLSLAETHPLLGAVRRAFKARELRSILYLVHPAAAAVALPRLDAGPPHVEAATL